MRHCTVANCRCEQSAHLHVLQPLLQSLPVSHCSIGFTAPFHQEYLTVHAQTATLAQLLLQAVAVDFSCLFVLGSCLQYAQNVFDTELLLNIDDWGVNGVPCAIAGFRLGEEAWGRLRCVADA